MNKEIASETYTMNDHVNSSMHVVIDHFLFGKLTFDLVPDWTLE